MKIDVHFIVADKLTVKDVCKAITSTCKPTQAEVWEVDGDVCEEILLVRTNKYHKN